MKLSETDNVWPVTIHIAKSVVSNELRMLGDNCSEGVALDQTTAAELLPILQHFIETGELQHKTSNSTQSKGNIMLDKFLALLERFVVAHELIAANQPKYSEAIIGEVVTAEPVKDEPKKTAKGRAKPEPEDKPTPKKKAPKGPDLEELRDEIKTMAKHIAAGDSDECADKFDELLEDFKVRTVTKLHDDDVEEFHKGANTLVGKYYEIEED